MRRLVALLVGLVMLAGCGSAPLAIPVRDDGQIIKGALGFESSPSNRYAILIKGAVFAPAGDNYVVSRAADMATAGRLIHDSFVENDIETLANLLASKRYRVHVLDMAVLLPEDAGALLSCIRDVANESTSLFFAYSGEGSAKFLMTRSFAVGGRLITTPDSQIPPRALLKELASIPGHKAVLLNACESGVFAQAAMSDGFSGVVIAACAQGFATTPNESSGHSAIFASFLDLYRDDTKTVKNLATNKISKAGDTWTNFRHKWVDFWCGAGLPISYEPVVFASADFLL